MSPLLQQPGGFPASPAIGYDLSHLSFNRTVVLRYRIYWRYVNPRRPPIQAIVPVPRPYIG
jgi:hypothetical protein